MQANCIKIPLSKDCKGMNFFLSLRSYRHFYMNQNLNIKTLWSKAGTAGAVLGAVSGIFIFLRADSISAPMASMAVSFILWLVKFILCIWLMMFFMKKLCREYSQATNADTFKFGMLTALLSSLICSAIYLADVLFITPDLFSAQMDKMMQMYSSMMDSNSMAMLEKMEDSYPQILFFSNLIYCFIYGTVLSAILSRSIPKNDPFASYGNEADEQ